MNVRDGFYKGVKAFLDDDYETFKRVVTPEVVQLRDDKYGSLLIQILRNVYRFRFCDIEQWIRLIISMGPDLEARDERGLTALYYAKYPISNILIQAGANVNGPVDVLKATFCKNSGKSKAPGLLRAGAILPKPCLAEREWVASFRNPINACRKTIITVMGIYRRHKVCSKDMRTSIGRAIWETRLENQIWEWVEDLSI